MRYVCLYFDTQNWLSIYFVISVFLIVKINTVFNLSTLKGSYILWVPSFSLVYYLKRDGLSSPISLLQTVCNLKKAKQKPILHTVTDHLMR